MTNPAITVRIAVVLALATGLLGTLMPSAQAASSGSRNSAAFGAQFHGTWASMSDRERARVLDSLVDAGATWVRIDVGWTTLQPDGRGKFDMRWGVPFLDKIFNMAHARGLKVLGMVWQTPRWANGSGNHRVLPRNPGDYAAALRFAARRWSRQVQAWQIWNEPNAREFLSPPDPKAYVRLLRAAYPAVKAGNRKALVVFGGTMYIDTKWIGRAYKAGAKGKFDIMAVHAYQGNSAKGPEANDRRDSYRMTHTGALVRLMRGNGDGGKRIWFTEFGWATHKTKRGAPIWEQGVSEARQADYLVRTLRLLKQRYPQVDHVFWYNSHDRDHGSLSARHQGLMRKNLSPKPALYALKCYKRGICNR